MLSIEYYLHYEDKKKNLLTIFEAPSRTREPDLKFVSCSPLQHGYY